LPVAERCRKKRQRDKKSGESGASAWPRHRHRTFTVHRGGCERDGPRRRSRDTPEQSLQPAKKERFAFGRAFAKRHHGTWGGEPMSCWTYRAQAWTTGLLFNVCCWAVFASGLASLLR
jgi:hypothetical protein